MQTHKHSHWQLAASLMELEHRKPQERDHQQQQQCSNNREVVSSASEQCRSPMIRLQLVSEWVNEHVWSTDCQLREKVWSNERARSRECKGGKTSTSSSLCQCQMSRASELHGWTSTSASDKYYANGRKNGSKHEKKPALHLPVLINSIIQLAGARITERKIRKQNLNNSSITKDAGRRRHHHQR